MVEQDLQNYMVLSDPSTDSSSLGAFTVKYDADFVRNHYLGDYYLNDSLDYRKHDEADLFPRERVDFRLIKTKNFLPQISHHNYDYLADTFKKGRGRFLQRWLLERHIFVSIFPYFAHISGSN